MSCRRWSAAAFRAGTHRIAVLRSAGTSRRRLDFVRCKAWAGKLSDLQRAGEQAAPDYLEQLSQLSCWSRRHHIRPEQGSTSMRELRLRIAHLAWSKAIPRRLRRPAQWLRSNRQAELLLTLTQHARGRQLAIYWSASMALGPDHP